MQMLIYQKKTIIQKCVIVYGGVHKGGGGISDNPPFETYRGVAGTYWVTQKLPQICTVILRIRIGKVA